MNITVTGNNTSLYGKSNGSYRIEGMRIRYINWVSYPKDVGVETLFASLDIWGVGTTHIQYTDKLIEKQISANKQIQKFIKQEIANKFKEAGIKTKIPSKMRIVWSEAGMQYQDGWNFDVIFK